MPREVNICNMSSLVSFSDARVKKLVRALDELPKNMRAPKGEISIAIMDDAKLAKIHLEFLADATKTDVITFEGDASENFAGEICVSAERARAVAKKFNNSANAELCLYIAHGFLHLAGIDDISEADAKKMRSAEAKVSELISKKFRKPIFNFKGE